MNKIERLRQKVNEAETNVGEAMATEALRKEQDYVRLRAKKASGKRLKKSEQARLKSLKNERSRERKIAKLQAQGVPGGIIYDMLESLP